MSKIERSPYPKIDKLRAKFDANKPLSLREVCFVLWAEVGVCSAQYLMFAYWVKENKLGNQSLRWPLWKSLFDSFATNDYPKMKDDQKLTLKIQKMGTAIVTGKKEL